MKYVFVLAGVIILGIVIVFSLPQTAMMQQQIGQEKAPELAGIAGWVNSPPLTIEGQRGKVVLVDFWTYSCINCIRTLPYLVMWHEKYADKGLVIIGVHTPEFPFEKDYENLKKAVEANNIKYAIAQDNEYATWRAYKNNYWPRKYIIDKEGIIRYDHIGEGGYEETEKKIQELLDYHPPGGGVEGEEVSFPSIGTPELYLGYSFMRSPLGNPEGVKPGEVVEYKKIPTETSNTIYLAGSWKNFPEYMESVENAQLSLIYTAKDLHSVLGGDGEVEVLLDSQPLDEKNRGTDVVLENGKSIIKIGSERLYRIVSAQQYGQHEIQLLFSGSVKVYTFTFG